MIIRCAHDAVVNVKDLKPHPQNRNKHPKEQIERLAKILEYQGWRYPIKVSKKSGFITSGHGRLEAARHLGWKQVPVNFQEYTDDAQEYADVQSDNAIASWAELDLSGINSDLTDLGPDFDLDLLGIKDFVLEPIEKLDPQCDEDEVPDALPEPKVVKGEVYILGKHRLMCGDSTAITDVERLMDGERADMVFTDPPYGIDVTKLRNPNWDNTSQQIPTKNYQKFDDSPERAKEIAQIFSTFTQPSIIWGANHFTDVIPQSPNWIVWHKLRDGQSNRNSDCELAVILNLKNKFSVRYFQHEWRGMIKASERGDLRLHPTQKPIILAEWCFENYGKPKSILDLFGGSGSTLIACEKTNRQCFMMELDPNYCGVILERWQKFTGKKAHREDGVAWDEIKAGVAHGAAS